MNIIEPELVAPADLEPHPRNYRTHPREQIRQIIASIESAGFYRNVVATRRGNVILAGHGVVQAALEMGLERVSVAFVDVDPDSPAALRVLSGDNLLPSLAHDDQEAILEILREIASSDDTENPLDGSGFTEEDLEKIQEEAARETDPEPDVVVVEDEAPETPADPITKPGDLWLMGGHRLLCGDSTSMPDANRLFGQETATLLHADPPYGMGKEKDGVANDNLYREKLDAFQMDWWRAWRPRIADNASAYIWGNAPDLWRLWYVGGLSEFESMTMRNEIVWDKGGAAAGGVSLEGSNHPRRYPTSTERCLFFMLGEQGFNINADNYWEGWEPIRCYLVEQFERCGWKTKEVAKWLGVNPRTVDHWISRSQWAFITKESYQRLQELAADHDAFKREHDELKREHDELKQEHDELKQEFYATRAHFDNTHDNMTDVWSFPRVTGEDRHGHATPKPVQMMARAIKSSSRGGDIVAVPFGGSGPELIAAEQLGRRYFGMELQPAYCDVIVQRWQNLTGGTAIREADGVTFSDAAGGALEGEGDSGR